mgnify:CR=1 FL=1
MTIPFFHHKDPLCRRISLAVPRDLFPHLMRDIGPDPSPERPRIAFHPLW